MICTLLPPLSGLTKIVSSASPRFRLSIEEAGVIRSLPSLLQPCALRFAANSAQTLFTFALLLKESCSTSCLYSNSDASLASARSLTLSLFCACFRLAQLLPQLLPVRLLSLVRLVLELRAETPLEFLQAA